MDNIAGSKSSLTWAVHISVAFLVVLWLFPTVGLLVSSFRTGDQIATSGWWAALGESEQNVVFRAKDPDDFREADGDLYVVAGNFFEEEGGSGTITVWGTSSRAIDAYTAGDVADLGDGATFTVDAEGNYEWRGPDEEVSGRGQRAFARGKRRGVCRDPAFA